LAKAADKPITTAYEHNMPRVEVKKRGRRPVLSQFTAAMAARIKFHNAIDTLARALDVPRVKENLTKARIDQSDLNRGCDTNRLENRREITRYC
jgi:hypothetical protein